MASINLTTFAAGTRKLTARTGYPATKEGVYVFPSEGEYPVYSDDTYDVMNDDVLCEAVYVEAIKKLVPDRTVLDIGTGRDANWAVEAAKAGARKVYAVEVIPEWAEAARKAVDEAGFSDTITVIEGVSTGVSLPEPIDVCVSEIIGSIGGSEGAAAAILDARERFMGGSGLSIPHRCVTAVAGASLASHFPDGLVLAPEGIETVQNIFEAVGHPFDVRLCLDGEVGETLLTETAETEELLFNGDLRTSGEDRFTLTVNRDDVLTGLVLRPILQAGSESGIFLDPIRQPSSWLPVYLPLLLTGIPVRAGDTIDTTFAWRLSDDGRHPDYDITGTIRRQGAPDVPFARHSPHHAATFRDDDIYRWLFPS
ncbi:50S ribosomal protein L11 methyltransferase [Streptomyces sp. NPDC055078]